LRISYNYQNHEKTIGILLIIFSFPLFSQEKINVLILQNEYAQDLHIITDVFEKVLNNMGNFRLINFLYKKKMAGRNSTIISKIIN
jgi:hypothetical protein